MSKIDVINAATRLAMLDASDVNGIDIFRAGAGGFGKIKQQQLLNDIRTLYAHVLGTRPGTFPPIPPGFDAA